MKKLLKIFLPLAVAGLFTCASAQAQSVTTESISFKLEDVTEMFMPPDLRMDIKFVDANNNNILEAEESGYVKLNIINKGGKADNVKVTVVPVNKAYGVNLQQSTFTSSVGKGGTWEVNVPMTASVNVPTGYTNFLVKVSEPMGYDINATLELSTFAFQKAKLTMNGVEISDSGVDTKPYNGNPDNKLQNMDVVRATVMIQNVGDGEAHNVTYKVTSNDPNIRLLTMSGYAQEVPGSVGDMLVGQVKEISFRLSPNAHYVHKGSYVPLYLTVTEDKGFGNITSRQIPIPFDAAAIKPEVVKVEANRDKLMASLGTKVVSNDERVSVASDAKFKDIMVAPHGQSIYPNAIAVVIGSEEYQDKTIVPAPYASRDAEVMTEYFKKSLGIKKTMTYINDEATMMTLNTLFDSEIGSLASMITPGQTDLYVYYSGHGVPLPNKDGDMEVYLIPYDVPKSGISRYGYSLNKLYADLGALNAKSVTVILDACFSGGSRLSDVYESKSITNQKYTLGDLDIMYEPWRNNPNFRLFTSSMGNQTSQANDRTRSGRFTYYLAVGLQGDADKDKNGKITMAELYEFVKTNVEKETQGQQTPQFYGNSDFVVEVIK